MWMNKVNWKIIHLKHTNEKVEKKIAHIFLWYVRIGYVPDECRVVEHTIGKCEIEREIRCHCKYDGYIGAIRQALSMAGFAFILVTYVVQASSSSVIVVWITLIQNCS